MWVIIGYKPSGVRLRRGSYYALRNLNGQITMEKDKTERYKLLPSITREKFSQ